ncbi:DUF4358 domain-containing protein [Anaerosporobacter sp.]|uniref:DUF4358 domain-containing protein n=1 Tax=Anaerosporobacter sp. TaxID=1872529 RepID=UPI00289AA0BC|nr:DUF4358 domain-containing protein [Anaerosporobacter sp.]
MRRMKKIVSLVMVGIMAFSLAACSSKKDDQGTGNVKEVPVSEIQTAVKDAYGEAYIPNMDYDAQTLESIFGVKEDWYEEFVAQGPMISAQVDTFVAIKAKEANVQEVVDALNSYRDYLVNDSMQYPMNQIKVQASRVEQVGNYVFFILLGEIPMEVEEQGEDAILATAKEQAQIAVDAINKVLTK